MLLLKRRLLQDFNLPLACMMGACSFEAYNVPYETHGIKQVDQDGAEVVYMDRDFLSSIIKGVMQVNSASVLSVHRHKRSDADEFCMASSGHCGLGLAW